MAARKVSYSPRESAYDNPMLPPAGRTGRGAVHESPAMATTNTSSFTPAIVLRSNSILPRNATAAIKSNATLPSHATSRLETPVMQSSWIQRLKPSGPTIHSEEELKKPPEKQNHVWTHFTKDFSSSSRCLNKAPHHTRSSSWPLDGPPCEAIGLPHLKLAEPANIEEQQHGPLVISPIFRDQNLCVPSEDTTHNSDVSLRIGNFFSNQQNDRKQGSVVEAPSTHNRGTSSEEMSGEPHEGEIGDGCKLEDIQKVGYAAGVGVSRFMKPSPQPEIISESRALLKGASARLVGDAHAKGGSFFSESVYRMGHMVGASADADDRIFSSTAFLKDVNQLTPVLDFSLSHGAKMQNKKENSRLSFVKLDCETAMSAPMLGNTVKKDRFGQTGLLKKEILGNDLDMGSNTGVDFGFLHFGRDSKAHRHSATKSNAFNGPCYGGACDRFRMRDWNFPMADASNRTQGKGVMAACTVGSSIVATTARPSTFEQSNAPMAINAYCRRGTNLVSSNNPFHLKEELVDKMPFTSAPLDEDVARSRIREISLEEYWNSWMHFFEQPEPQKPEETGSSTASLPQDYILEEYRRHSLKFTANTKKCDATEKLKDFSSPSPHSFVNAVVENHSSYDLPQQTCFSSFKNYKMLSYHENSPIQIKQTGWGGEHCASADRTSLDGLKSLKQSREQKLYKYKGATGRVASQVHIEDHERLNLHPRLSYGGSANSGMHFTHQSLEFCNDEKTGEASSTHHAWIQRWCSSANVCTMSGEASTLSRDMNGDLSYDLLVKHPVSSNASAQCAVGPSYKGQSNMGSFDHILTESGRGSCRPVEEASGTLLDSGSGSTLGGSLPAGRSYVSWRGTCMAPWAEAMAIAGTSARKLHTSSLQNRGSFSVWPCTSAEVVKSTGLSEHVKGTAEDKLHLMEMDDLGFLRRHIG